MTAMEQPGLVDSSPHPWRRYLARLIDALLLLILATQVRFIIDPGFAWPKPLYLFALVLHTLLILPEAVLLATWGSTPGKWIFSIRIQNRTGGNLSFWEGLIRGWRVLWRGRGLGIPFLGTILLVIAYRNLEKDRETPWDREGGHVVNHDRVNPLRGALVFIGLLVVVALLRSYGAGRP